MLETTGFWKAILLCSIATPSVYVAFQIASKAARAIPIDWQVAVAAWAVSFAFSLMFTVLFACIALVMRFLLGSSRYGWLGIIVTLAVLVLIVGVTSGPRAAATFALFAAINAFAFAMFGGHLPRASAE